MSINWNCSYPTVRTPTFAENAVATSHPLAAQTGIQILMNGGNAVDAALATAIATTVLEPVASGIGGDAMAMIWDGSTLHAINGSGRASSAITRRSYSEFSSMPTDGPATVTTPGAVATWVAMSERFGQLPFEKLFQPAIHYATYGFIVPVHIGKRWKALLPSYRRYPEIAALFAQGDSPPEIGQKFRLPRHAETLAEIAETAGESFYRGRLAKLIVESCRDISFGLTIDDLSEHTSDWVTPLKVTYRGHDVHEIPPNGQGVAALTALGILDYFDLGRYELDSPELIHLQIEAMKLAFADAYHHVGDPKWMKIDPSRLINGAYLRERSRLIDPARAQFPKWGIPRDSGTVYLATGDAKGMMVSMIQSNGRGFGSGVVVPGTGICLHNRGSSFTLENGHPNQVGPGKRPFHTIVPAFITRNDKPVLSFGVMGYNMQPQAHVQVVSRLLDHEQNPQALCDAPRW